MLLNKEKSLDLLEFGLLGLKCLGVSIGTD